MKHQLIKTDNYLLVINDEEIEINDWFYSIPRMTYHRAIGLTVDTIIDHTWEDRHSVEITKSDCKKIIAHKPLNGAPYLDGVDVLPELPKENNNSYVPDWVYEKLCVYDERNPDYLPYDEDDLTKKPTNCACDNCYYGRTKMAEFILS